MRLSTSGIKTQKERIINSKELLSRQIMLQAGLLHKFEDGLYGKHNLLTNVQSNIEQEVRKVLNQYDCVEVSMPVLHSAKEGMLSFVQNSLASNEDLPVTLYQIGKVLQNDILPYREFTMMEACSFHLDHESLKEKYHKMENIYFEIFNMFGLLASSVLTFVNDTGCVCTKKFMIQTKTGSDDIQVGHIMQEDIPNYIGYYNININSLFDSIAETYCDKDGLCWPGFIAPYKVMIVYTHNQREKAFNLYNKFQYYNIPTVIDDRDGIPISSKIRDWKLFGIPYLLYIGKNFNEDTFEITSRKTGLKNQIPFFRLLYFLKNLK